MFTHLHVHTHFSFGIGASSPEALIAAAGARGFGALACTDSNGVYGAVEFQQAAEAAGIRPILGAHLVAQGEEVVALAEDERGWGALCRAITAIHWADQSTGGSAGAPVRDNSGAWRETPSPAAPIPPARRPPSGARREAPSPAAPIPPARCPPSGAWREAPSPAAPIPPARRPPAVVPATAPPDRAPLPLLSTQLAVDRRGLILLSNDVGFLERVLRSSGPEGLYAELRPGRERHAVLAAARRLGLPSAVTGAVAFAHPEDWARHRLLRAICFNTTLSACNASHLAARDAWLRPASDLARLFPDCPEALSATQKIAERCRYRIPIGRTVTPRIAEAEQSLGRLRALAYEGAGRRYGVIAPVTRDRLEHELRIIGMKGFADYFLVVHDIVQHGPTHCGRGSVANSIVSYCLGITHVEPLGAGLLFERFLNPERKDPPDIDLDFPWDERDRVLAYVFRQYPHPRAAMVANHNCFRLRGALREVAKVHGRPPGEIREITRRFPWFSESESLGELLATHPNFQNLDLPEGWRELAAQAQPLVGIPRHLSLHPGGVVIVPTALTDYVPVEIAAKVLDGFPDLPVPVIQFEKDGAEDAGLVKIDLLGNRSLAVIRDAIAAVGEHTGRKIDYTSSDPEQDEPTKALFRTGQTMGVFYTESPASRLLCAKSRADSFELLVLNTSIIRPASNRYIRCYLERLHGAPWAPLDPCLRDTLATTFGVMVYQEDVVNVCAEFAGMPLATGDGLRKALSKKRPVKHLAAYVEEFFAGAATLGRDPETAKRVWEMVLSFAGYSFCKGHSCSYIRVAQHSCYLRAHYPAEFMAAVLANGGGFYASFAYIAEAMRMGLTILPPDVNASDFRCTGRDRELRIGLQFVKGLSEEGVGRLLGERGGWTDGRTGGQADKRTLKDSLAVAGGQENTMLSDRPTAHPPVRPFGSLPDLAARTGLSAEDLRLLIKVGACDSIANGWTRPMMLWWVDGGERGEGGGEKGTGERGTLKGFLAPGRASRSQGRSVAGSRERALPPLREYSPDRQRQEQYAALGFTTDAHPMRLYADRLRRFRLCSSTELHRQVGRSVLLAGMLTTAKPVHTVQDEPMEFVTFDDGDGLIEAVLFPRVYRERGHVLFDQGPFIFRGKVEEEFGAVTVTVSHLDRLERMLEKVGHYP